MSVVAAMTWHGMKKTLPAVAPLCVLADTDIFGRAPFRLTASGLAMQMTGNSRPASGAEHHVSHLWEMSIINDPVPALPDAQELCEKLHKAGQNEPPLWLSIRRFLFFHRL